jgi:hypothetical protein
MPVLQTAYMSECNALWLSTHDNKLDQSTLDRLYKNQVRYMHYLPLHLNLREVSAHLKKGIPMMVSELISKNFSFLNAQNLVASNLRKSNVLFAIPAAQASLTLENSYSSLSRDLKFTDAQPDRNTIPIKAMINFEFILKTSFS